MTILDVQPLLGNERDPTAAGRIVASEILVLAIRHTDIVVDVSRLDRPLLTASFFTSLLTTLKLADQALGPDHLRLHWKARHALDAQAIDNFVRRVLLPSAGAPRELALSSVDTDGDDSRRR